MLHGSMGLAVASLGWRMHFRCSPQSAAPMASCACMHSCALPSTECCAHGLLRMNAFWCMCSRMLTEAPGAWGEHSRV